MKYTLDGDNNIVNLEREKNYVDMLLAICDMSDKQFYGDFLRYYCVRAEFTDFTHEQIANSIDMMCRERAIMLADM